MQMIELGQLKVSPHRARTADDYATAPADHPFVPTSVKLPFTASPIDFGRSQFICWNCGENRLKETSRHYVKRG